jgi:hypothetical protein
MTADASPVGDAVRTSRQSRRQMLLPWRSASRGDQGEQAGKPVQRTASPMSNAQ